MAVEWDDLVQSTIFTRIKNEIPSSLKTKYKMTNDNFSAVGSSDAPSVFPFVMLQQISMDEKAKTLNGTKISSGNFGFQIDVYDNISDQRAEEVMRAIKAIMLTMSFTCKKQPSAKEKNIYRKTYRFNRIICSNDIL